MYNKHLHVTHTKMLFNIHLINTQCSKVQYVHEVKDPVNRNWTCDLASLSVKLLVLKHFRSQMHLNFKEQHVHILRMYKVGKRHHIQ